MQRRSVILGAIVAGAVVAPGVFAGCAGDAGPVVIDLAGDPAAHVARTFDVTGARDVRIVGGDGHLVEAWADGGLFAGRSAEQLASGASAAWLAPAPATGELALVIEGDGAVTLTVDARGDALPSTTRPILRDHALAWLDGALLDDPTVISFARVMSEIGDDGHGGVLLDRWFRAFAAGPGAGRATFAQFLDGIVASQGADPATWDLGALPFKVTGIHDRIDLANGEHCGELRVSIASTHPTFAPVHLIFLFRQEAGDADVTPDGRAHCRGTARAWARLAGLEPAAFRTAAAQIVAAGITHDRFLLAESVELSLSPWQWRQWIPDGTGGLVNPPLFQTVDVDRVNAPGATRDAFLAAVTANAAAIAARRWTVPAMFRGAVAEVQPNAQAPLVDLSPLAVPAELPRALGMIGCPRCHTDDADFLQTGIDRRPSPFYDRELDARALRLEALGRGEFPPPPPFGPLQPL